MTRFGWSLVVGAGALIAVGVVTGWLPAAVLGIGTAVVAAVALLFLVRPVNLVISRDVQPKSVTKGGQALALYSIRNRGLRSPAVAAHQSFGDLDVRVVIPRLSRGEQTLRSFRLPTDRRGVFRIGALEAQRSDPFSIVERRWRYGMADELRVYPAILPFRTLPTGRAKPIDGRTRETAPEGSTFHRLREYVPGDDPRLIHWKSTARTGTVMVRHNVDTAQPFSVVVTDLRPSLYSDDSFELALDGAASAVVASVRGRSPIEFLTTGGHRLGGQQLVDAQPILDVLTEIGPDPNGSLGEVFRLLRRHRGGTALTIITGDATQDDLAGISSFHRKFQRIVVVRVVGPGDDGRATLSSVEGVSVARASSAAELTAVWNVGTS